MIKAQVKSNIFCTFILCWQFAC